MRDNSHIEKEIAKGLLRWYDFSQSNSLLYIGQEDEPLVEYLEELGLQIEVADVEGAVEQTTLGVYDFIIAVKSLEKQKNPIEVLKVWKGKLRENGKLILGMNNRYGLKYFCGEIEPYNGICFTGIEGYRGRQKDNRSNFSGRCYSRNEIEEMLQVSGFEHVKLYAVLPDLEHPQLIYADGCLPNEELASRLYPVYKEPWRIFMEEERIYTGLARNGLFHAMANTFLIECPIDGMFSDVRHVTFTSERSHQDACMTVILENGRVEKRAIYQEGQHHIEEIAQNHRELRERGVACVEVKREGNCLIMPYLEGNTAQVYLAELMKNNLTMFFKEFDRFKDLVWKSSEVIGEDKENGVILKKGYLDMVPLNCIYKNGEFIFIDQELYKKNCPAKLLFTRMIRSFYYGNEELLKVLPINVMLERYGVLNNADYWSKMEDDFLAEFRNESCLQDYHRRYRADFKVMEQTRNFLNRMNFRMDNIFENVGKRRLIVFGAGKYADKFIALFGNEYNIHAIVDNDIEKWGQEMYGSLIQSPERLTGLDEKKYKVVICVKEWYPVAVQLGVFGIKDYVIYNPNMDYPRNRWLKRGIENTTQLKKYHVGYVAGVFDLFHKGHLNLIKRAKEQCDYLIVGVVNDERVKWIKGEMPFIPFDERLEIVASCRYVDEAVEIPTVYGDSHDAYVIYHFDCQFSGNDHANDPYWLKEKQYLQEHGSDLVFFPYTEGTSSTMLKSLIRGSLGTGENEK